MIFIRFWNLAYVTALLASLGLRVSDSVIDSVGAVGLNAAALAAMTTTWFMWERRTKIGNVMARILSVLRAAIILLNGSILFAFVAAYVPTAPLWSLLLRLSTPLYLISCFVMLTLEILYFRKIGARK